MDGQIIAEIKQLQTVMQTMNGNIKTLDQSLERLRSIEQLLERVAGSNERMEQMFQRSLEMYSQLGQRR